MCMWVWNTSEPYNYVSEPYASVWNTEWARSSIECLLWIWDCLPAYIILLRKPSVAGIMKSATARVSVCRAETVCYSWMGQIAPVMSWLGQPGCPGTPQEVLRTVHGSQLPGWTCIPCCVLYYSKACQGRKRGANTDLPYLLNLMFCGFWAKKQGVVRMQLSQSYPEKHYLNALL